MAFSVASVLLEKCLPNQASPREWAPYLDIITGIALIILGSLCVDGTLAIGGGAYVLGLGGLSLLIGAALKSWFCLKHLQRLHEPPLSDAPQNKAKNFEAQIPQLTFDFDEPEINLHEPKVISVSSKLQFSMHIRRVREGEVCLTAENVTFYFYNCDGNKDEGWGCAWRAIQTCASSLGLIPSFGYLYRNYSVRGEEKEWAEPGYGKRYLDDAGFGQSEVALYNTKSGTEKTPNWQKIYMGFDALKAALIEHFEQNKTPVMADDTLLAYTILGIKTLGDRTILWIADPHRTDWKSGLYFVSLDEEGKSEDRPLFNFKDKRWLLLFPKRSYTRLNSF